MKIFVTGGTGFIGPFVVNRLIKDDHQIILLTDRKKSVKKNFLTNSKEIDIVSGNLSNISEWENSLQNHNPDLTIHLAWEGIPNYNSEMSAINLKYGLDLYLTLARIGCKRILTSGSCWEYGITKGSLSEEINPNPSNPFTIAKNSLRLMGEELAKEYNLQFLWMRFFYVYGPGQKLHSLLPYIISSVLNKKIPQIRTPNSKNDFVFVEDVANAIALIIKNCTKSQNIYNIGSGYSTSVKKIIEITYDKCKTSLPDEIFKMSQESEISVDFWADISKIKTEIGWEPKVSISEGIKRMIDDFRLKAVNK